VFGRVPKRDESIVTGEYRLTILEANAERARRVRIERSSASGAAVSL
jgi:CBS domain containing-hemolysin-like protein